eukprot:TRINITY_DN15012_c0_g1_i2.p1 TRINITY_DN15012_c0_g1~~TRINITY_DN15012_c0_g1_i2.p1  ORF type:complete len:177 (+),score=15.79 TRINITY_DN15012_c0_g1_i2:169-699(+)
MSNALLAKVIIIGDAKVGKSSLMKRFIDDEFSDEYLHTIGVDYAARIVEFGHDATKLQIWDTAGQERFRIIINSYYRDSKGYIVMYDVSDIESFNHLKMWIASIAKLANKKADPYIMLVGNKSDVDISDRVVSAEDGRKLANQFNIPFFETSAKTGSNVDDVFLRMISGIKSKQKY